MRLVVIRHGQTGWSRDFKQSSTSDIALTRTGIAECRSARELLTRLTGDLSQYEAVYSSPRRRAMDTAMTIFGDAGGIVPLEQLSEIDFGAFEGLTHQEIWRDHPGWRVWDEPCPGGESISDVGRRADDFLRFATSRHLGTVAVVSHGIMLRVLTVRAVGLPPAAGGALSIDTGSVGIVDEVRGRTVITKWNFRSELEAGVLP
jgi:probable phosphoglycerate mutase